MRNVTLNTDPKIRHRGSNVKFYCETHRKATKVLEDVAYAGRLEHMIREPSGVELHVHVDKDNPKGEWLLDKYK
jgi:hypothetical protein